MDGLALYDGSYSSAVNPSGSTISKGRRVVVTVDSSGALSIALAGNSVVGDAVTTEDIPTLEVGRIRWYRSSGVHQLECGAAVAANATVTADTNGRVNTGGGTTVGRSLNAGAGAGSYINVIQA